MKYTNKYNEIASFYDDFIPDFWGSNHSFLNNYFIDNTNKKTVLDLGCGTGILLNYYKKFIDSYIGVDHSVEMLNKASNIHKENIFINSDIVQYMNYDIKFDIILSLYDTINHLLDKTLWSKLFYNISKMIMNEGVFIFDICTKNDLENNWPNYMNVIDNENYMIISNGEFDKESKISKIHHNYFIKENNIDKYFRKYDCIEHISFEIQEIINMLNNVNFNNIEVFDFNTKNSVTDNTTVAVFICRKN